MVQCHHTVHPRGGRTMKTRGALSQVLFSTVLVLVITFASACATVPPQVRPVSPDPFAGTWEGSWQSLVGRGSGGVKVAIEQPTGARPQHVVFHASLTNAVVPGFSREARFENGKLIVDLPTLWMEFQLRGSHQMVANYENRWTGDRGTWWLSRK